MEMIQFTPDESRRKAAVKALRQHSGWQRVFLALIFVSLIWLIVAGFLLDGGITLEVSAIGPYESGDLMRSIVVMSLALLVGGTPLIAFLRLRWSIVDDPVKGRNKEVLGLMATGIEQHYYHVRHRRNDLLPREQHTYTFIPYASITRIELYEDVQALKVYGTVYICDRPGAPTEESIRKVIDDPDKAYRVFFLYYHDADKLVQLISDRSGKPVTRLQHCTGSLQEVK